MALVISNPGKLILLDVKRPLLNTFVCGLFQNNYVPVPGMNLAAFVPATFQGYATKAVNFGGAAVLTVAGKGLITATLLTWTPTGIAVQNTIFGYYVYRVADGLVAFAERNPAGGIVVGNDLSPFTVQLNFSEDTDPNP
jgi:hypothetical protein